MNKLLTSKQIVVSFFVGIFGVAMLSSWVTVSAQTESQEISTATRIKDPTQLKLQSVQDTFIPPSLEIEQPPEVRGVFGQDQRIPMTSQQMPWSAIGRVEMVVNSQGQKSHCTGTLVTKNVVLTNAHCVVNHKTSEFYSKVKFYPNMINGKARDVAYPTKIYLGTDFKDGNYNDDWAFIVLDKPIGEDYGYLGWKSLSPDTLIKDKKKYVFVGYSGDFPNSPQYRGLKAGPGMTAGIHPGCSITGEEDGLLKHDCDTTGGSSGGPIIAWINQKPYIVALNNMEVTSRASGTPLFNLAVKISRIKQVLNGQ